ncbi:MAG TPA: 3D domain-containing protein [Vicinamibacterales bacterium]|jgi:3D (Asp-Asp-Asp) domain-containing protein|nr:3D domain-containing protein [Vicinamibacterales bacterium]
MQPSYRKLLVTVVVALLFVGAYEVTTHDARREDPNAPPRPGSVVTLSATAYCKGSTTAAGVAVQPGAAASDPSLFPLGSIVQMDTGDARYDGMYTVLDTGPEIKGRELDIYIWSCYEALDFGRRQVKVTLLRRGWNPQALASPDPSFIDRVLRRKADQPKQQQQQQQQQRQQQQQQQQQKSASEPSLPKSN